MLVLLLLSMPFALAQELPVLSAPVPALPVVGPQAIGAKYVWVRRGQPETVEALDDIAVDPSDPAVWLAVDERGAVWRTADAGTTWILQLAGRRVEDPDDAADDERILLQAESAQTEELSRVTVDDPGEGDPSDADSTSSQAARDAVEAVVGTTGGRGAVAMTPGRVWFDPAEPGVALVGRPDGVWRSADQGRAWELADRELGASEFFRWGGVLVIGGAQGIRASLDGGYSYLDLAGVAEGSTVYQFAGVGTDLYAGTSSGLFRSPDGLHWSRVGAAGRAPIRTVVPDLEWSGGLWIAGEEGLLRSDDGGQTFYSAGTQPLRGLRRILALPGRGHLLAIGSDGVWESLDGGVRWVLSSRRLTEPDVRGVSLRAGLPVLATADGVWQLDEPARTVEERVEPLRGLALGDAVERSLRRPGMDQDVLSLANRSALLMIVPTIEFNGSLDVGHGRASSFLLLQTTEARDARWTGTVRLCWGGCGASYTTAYSDTYGDALSDVLGNENLSVINGEVYEDTAIVAAAANVSQAISRYRMSVARSLAETWLTRQRLAGEAELVRDRPIPEQVSHQLKIDELNARMDVWTDGAWSASLRETLEVQ